VIWEERIPSIVNKNNLAIIAIIGGIVVFSIKLSAYLVSNSIALLSDALESIINIIASIMLFFSLRIAARPPDEEHKFGHKKAENISCLVEGMLVLIAAFFIIEASVGRIFNPVELSSVNLALLISLTATGLNGGLSYALWKESKRSGSIAMEGDSKHLLSDVLSSVGVVIGLFIASITGYYILDPLMALIVAAIIIKMGVDLLKKSSRDLMDHHCPESEEKITEVMQREYSSLEFHELKTRRSGDTVFAEMKVCVDGEATVQESHALTEKIERDLKKEIPGINLIIHVEDKEKCGLHKVANP
jgi:cation diffusion facilitator family transporter